MTKYFYILMAGESTSRIGNNLFDIAIMWYLYKLTSNSLLIGVSSGLFNALVLLNILTGYLADRARRLIIMISVDILQALLMLASSFVLHSVTVSALFIIMVIFLSKLLGVFFDPAEDALLPDLVSQNSLSKTNGINQGTQVISQLIDMFIGGSLITSFPMYFIFEINGITFLISLTCLGIIMHSNTGYVPSASVRKKAKLFDGLNFVKNNPGLLIIMLLAILINLVLGPIMSLDVVWVENVLNGSSFVYSIVQISMLVGIILGNIIVNIVKIRIKQQIVMSLVTTSVSILTFSLFKSIFLTCLMMLLMGVGAGTINVTTYTFLQHITPRALMGRVNGLMITGTNLSLPIGMILGGVLSKLIGVKNVFLGGALIALIVTVVFSLSNVPSLDIDNH
ncbi:MFS transporter [Pediococcus ethanolidurans]|uniref:MFS transporter n=1 Tax=Pediococcus ethanolidurans TaxID=319653 RepID=UPI0021E7E8B9|nr:MFS transporter [Pediococcus ethanolidurans]MCV3316277.1 MFS transporter [Pediococcus ethanolidurans]